MSHFHVTFSKSLLSSDGHPFRCPQEVVDLDAIDAETAVKTAKRRFEHLLRLRSWRMRADFADVSCSQFGPELIETYGPLRFTCPVRRRDFYSGIDTDARTFSRISGLDVRTQCPFCHTTHTLHAIDGTLAYFVHLPEPGARPCCEHVS